MTSFRLAESNKSNFISVDSSKDCTKQCKLQLTKTQLSVLTLCHFPTTVGSLSSSCCYPQMTPALYAAIFNAECGFLAIGRKQIRRIHFMTTTWIFSLKDLTWYIWWWQFLCWSNPSWPFSQVSSVDDSICFDLIPDGHSLKSYLRGQGFSGGLAVIFQTPLASCLMFTTVPPLPTHHSNLFMLIYFLTTPPLTFLWFIAHLSVLKTISPTQFCSLFIVLFYTQKNWKKVGQEN